MGLGEASGKSAVSHWETGRTLPSPATIERLANALRCATDELMVAVVTPYDALRGKQELPGPAVLLSPDEETHIRLWRRLDPKLQACLNTVITAVIRRHQ